MTTTPPPAADPSPPATPDPDNEELSGPREPDVEEPTIDHNELTDDD